MISCLVVCQKFSRNKLPAHCHKRSGWDWSEGILWLIDLYQWIFWCVLIVCPKRTILRVLLLQLTMDILALQTFGIANDVDLTNMLVLALEILLYSWLLFRSSYLNKEKSLANDKLTCATPTYYHVIIFMFLSRHNCILFHIIPYMCCELSAKISPS